MKKTMLAILLCGVMVLGITGCGSSNTFDVGNVSDVEISNNNGVTLSIKDDTLKNTGATFILKNDSDMDVQYGDSYEIEIEKDSRWHKINVELNFNSPAYTLKTKTSEEIELKWENEYGKLAPGNYRILKSIDTEMEDGTFNTFYVAAEFTIK